MSVRTGPTTSAARISPSFWESRLSNADGICFWKRHIFCKFFKKRSLDANAYAWVLIGKIAKAIGVPKNDVYMQFIRDIGDYDIVCIKEEAAPTLIRAWEGKGLGWQTETTLSKLDGCTNVLLYYGSSCYTTEQMSRFINYIQEICADYGIEVRPQDEIDALLDSWEGRF